MQWLIECVQFHEAENSRQKEQHKKQSDVSSCKVLKHTLEVLFAYLQSTHIIHTRMHARTHAHTEATFKVVAEFSNGASCKILLL